MTRNKRMITSLALVIILLATLTVEAWAQSPVTRMRNVAITILRVTSGLTTDDLTVSDDATITGDLTVTGEIDANGDTTLTAATVGTFLTLDAADVITVTNGATLSPTGSYQPIAAAGAVGFGAITVGAAGTVLLIENTSSNSITITDTGTLKLSGNAALGQFDMIMLVSDGTNWVQAAPESDN